MMLDVLVDAGWVGVGFLLGIIVGLWLPVRERRQ